MGKDLHKDKFEEFIKNSLDRFDENPSDDMWNRIQPIIPPKPPVWWKPYLLPTSLVFTSALLIFLGVKLYEYKTVSETLSKELEETSHQVEALTHQVEALDNSTSKIASIQNEENTTSNTNEAITPTQNLNNIATNITSDHSNKETKQKAIISSNTPPIPNKDVNKKTTLKENTPPFSKASNELEKLQNTVVNNPVVLDSLLLNKSIQNGKKPILTPKSNSLPIAINEQEADATKEIINVEYLNSLTIKPENQTALPIIDPISAPSNSVASINIFVGPSLLHNRLKKLNNNKPSFPRPKETMNVGKMAGIYFSSKINNKWRISAGGYYSSSSFNFHTNDTLQYHRITEQFTSNEHFSNKIFYNRPTSYGNLDLDIDIIRHKDTLISPKENIDMELDATIEIKQFSIPIYLTYYLFDNGKLLLGLKGGLSYNYIIKHQIEINNFQIDKPGFELKKYALRNIPRPSQHMAINGLAGLSVEYKLLDHWSICVEPTISTALTENHRGHHEVTKSTIFGLETGVRYSF